MLYLLENHKNLELIWISKNRDLVSSLNNIGITSFYAFSLKGIWSCLIAEMTFTTHGLHDANPFVSGGTIFFEMTHTLFPMKKIRFDIFDYYRFIDKMLLKINTNPEVYRSPDMCIASSDYTAEIMKTGLRIGKKNILVTGHPKTDNLLNYNISENCEIKEFFLKKYNLQYEKLIYVAPTCRGDVTFDLFSSSFSFNEKILSNFLEKIEAVIIFSFHPSDSHYLSKRQTFLSPRIFINYDYILDSYSLLHSASVLITDYSSLYSDFLLFDRPIVFSNFWHDQFLEKRELYSSYDSVTPGPKAEDWKEIQLSIEDILIKGIDQFKNERSLLIEKIYKFKDSKASQRVMQELSYRLGREI